MPRRTFALATIRSAVLLSGAAVGFGALAQDASPSAGDSVTGTGEASSGVGMSGQAAPPVLTLDQDRLFQDSAWGRAALAAAEREATALAAENRRIEDALENEERSLTERRATMSAEDFARLATEFDARVEEIRAAQEAKSRAISRRIEDDRRKFFEAATPVLGQLLEETGAVAILSDSAIVMSLTSLDMTEAAIQRMDNVLPPPDDGPDDGPAPGP